MTTATTNDDNHSNDSDNSMNDDELNVRLQCIDRAIANFSDVPQHQRYQQYDDDYPGSDDSNSNSNSNYCNDDMPPVNSNISTTSNNSNDPHCSIKKKFSSKTMTHGDWHCQNQQLYRNRQLFWKKQQQSKIDPTIMKNEISSSTSNLVAPNTSNANSTTGSNNSSNNTISIQDILQLYAPIGLEKQFEDLYRTLRPCLLPPAESCSTDTSSPSEVPSLSNRESTSTTIGGAAATTTSSTTRIQSNASAFLQGSRGCGKTVVLHECIQALYDEQRWINANKTKTTKAVSSSSLFRIVHLNGITVPGYSVHTVVREILNQLSNIAMTESRNTSSRRKRQQQQNYHDPMKRNDTNNENNNHERIIDRKSNGNKRMKSERNGNDSNNNNIKAKPNENSDNKYNDIDDENETREDANEKRLEILLRLKQTSFSNQLQLLTEILQLASIDGVPILFILEELDTFLGIDTGGSNNNSDTMNSSFTNDRQVLLYHLLDRVATSGSYCSFVGITATSSLMGRFEKRIKSRAEGTTKFIHFGPCPTFTTLVHIFISKFNDNHSKSNATDKPLSNQLLQLEISDILSEDKYKTDLVHATKSSLSIQQHQHRIVYEAIQRDYKLGKDIRWFSRVFYLALSMYRQHLIMIKPKKRQIARDNSNNGSNKSNDQTELTLDYGNDLSFQPKFLLDSLVDMGGSVSNVGSSNYSSTTASSTSCGTGNVTTNDETVRRMIESNPRLCVLQDLSGPEIAILFSCRRILARESFKHENGTNQSSIVQPSILTIDRMIYEYRSTYKSGSGRYNLRMLRKAVYDLMNVGLLRPASDHTGVGPLQYHLDNSIIGCNDENMIFSKMPVHVTIDIHREFKMAMDCNIFHCTTALREWGRKIN